VFVSYKKRGVFLFIGSCIDVAEDVVQIKTHKKISVHIECLFHIRGGEGFIPLIGSCIDVAEDVTQTQTHKKISVHMNCLFHIRGGVYSFWSGPVSTLLKTSHKYKHIKISDCFM